MAITVDNGTLTDYSVKTTQDGSDHIQHLRPDLDAPYAVRIDEGATYTYIGHAAPGSAENSSVWRIKRMTNSTSAILWADGNGSFDNDWSTRASLTYS